MISTPSSEESEILVMMFDLEASKSKLYFI